MNESLYPFVNHTTYDLKALGAMNRLAELSVRREKSRRTKGICGVLGLIGLVGGVYCYPHQNLVGSLMPLLAKRLGLDPTVMASPLISTILDAVSLILFFNIAVAVLNM